MLNEVIRVEPDPPPTLASPSIVFAGSWVTRLIAPPSAFGPSSGDV